MTAFDLRGSLQIGDRPRQPQDAMKTSCGETHALGRLDDQSATASIAAQNGFDDARWGRSVCGGGRQTKRGVSLGLNEAGREDARRRLRGSFARRRQDQIGGVDRGGVNAQVKAVEKRSIKPRRVSRDASFVRLPLAGVTRVVRMAAPARIHRRHELETGGIDDAVVSARDRHFARFKGLAKAIQRLGLSCPLTSRKSGITPPAARTAGTGRVITCDPLK